MLLIQAKAEIERLRRENEILSAKVEVLDLFSFVLRLQRASHPMTEDVAWALQKQIDLLSSNEAPISKNTRLDDD